MKKKYLAWMAIVMIALTGIFTGCGSSADEAAKEEKASQVDVDLTQMSSTMVYSEVFNMVNEPDDYLGKMIKMEGTFALYHDENTGKDYYACIIQDATACCAQGIEFVLTEEYACPADYPQEGGFITVTGVFDTYQEGSYTYCTLREARLG